jgi:hypothetical protein
MYPALDSSSQCLGSGQRPLGLLFTVHDGKNGVLKILTICVSSLPPKFSLLFSTILSLGGLYGYRLPFFCTQSLYVRDRTHTKVISCYVQGQIFVIHIFQ